VAFDMKLEKIIEWDQRLFLVCQRRARNRLLLKKSMKWVAKSSSKVFAVVYVSVAVILLMRDDARVIQFLIVPAVTLLLTAMLRFVFNRPRPFEIFDFETGIEHESGSSFPSQHTSSAMIIALSILWVFPLAGVIMLLLALLTAVSRVISGVHFPLDVFAGTALACLLSGLLFLNIR
jgi:undecaprenyl-diphosphatase